MSYICPVCNGLESVHIGCKNCGHALEDHGRYQDFFDDYSAYMEVDEMKKCNGIKDDFKTHKCPHLLFCTNCNEQSIILLREI